MKGLEASMVANALSNFVLGSSQMLEIVFFKARVIRASKKGIRASKPFLGLA